MNCWHDEIDRSITEDDVTRSARDYLALWSPNELKPLTLGWRELKIERVCDIARVKRWLIDTPELRELATYFWHAAARIEEIRRARPPLRTVPAMSRVSASIQ